MKKIKLAKGKCAVEGCDKLAERKGCCLLHYSRFWRTGRYSARTDLSIMERIKQNMVIANNGCHEWTGQLNSMGYARMSIGGKLVLVHRYIFEVSTGNKSSGFCVCHSCDNPKCINPQHLFLGTISDNIRDMFRKGRCSNLKLTESQVAEIKSSSKHWKELAKIYNISGSYVRCLKCGHSRNILYG